MLDITLESAGAILKEYGPPTGIFVLFFFVLLRIATKVLPEAMTVARKDYLVALKEARTEHADEVKLARADFNASLLRQQESFDRMLTRIEVRWQDTANRICDRLDDLAEKVERLAVKVERIESDGHVPHTQPHPAHPEPLQSQKWGNRRA